MHGEDAGEAYRLALLSDARGAERGCGPDHRRGSIRQTAGARAVQLPKQALSAAMAGAWRLRLIPSDESLLKMFVSLPTLDASRIRAELGWQPQHSGADALREVMEAMAEGAGGPLRRCTPPASGHEAPRNDSFDCTLTGSLPDLASFVAREPTPKSAAAVRLRASAAAKQQLSRELLQSAKRAS